MKISTSFFDWTLVRVRRIQLVWEIKNLGAFNLFYLGLFAIILFFVHHYAQSTPEAWYVLIFLLVSILSFHFSRTDFAFMYQHFEQPSKAIFWEYFSGFSLFAFPLLFSPNWYLIFVFWIGTFLISQTKPKLKKRTFLKKINQYIPAKNFELISGLRQTFLPVFGLYLLSLVFCWVRGIPIFFLWFITVIFCSYFSYAEPLHILRQTEKNVHGFLWGKVGRHAAMLTILYLPVCIGNFFFHPELWWLQLAATPLQVLLLAVVIFFKYATYRPNAKLTENQAAISVNALAALVPFLFPIPFIFAIIYYRRAKNNLKYYLDD